MRWTAVLRLASEQWTAPPDLLTGRAVVKRQDAAVSGVSLRKMRPVLGSRAGWGRESRLFVKLAGCWMFLLFTMTRHATVAGMQHSNSGCR